MVCGSPWIRSVRSRKFADLHEAFEKLKEEHQKQVDQECPRRQEQETTGKE
jgi:DNA-binding ferritin-like protein